MSVWVCDTEGDNLLDNITKFHCLVFKNYLKSEFYVFCNISELPKGFIEKYPEIRFFEMGLVERFLKSDCVSGLACHNIIGFDLPAMKKLLGFDYYIKPDKIFDKNIKIIDTLVMSRVLNPDRQLPKGCPAKVLNATTGKLKTVGPHGLEAWGYRVANLKPDIQDWSTQPLDVYVHRCIEDVKINELVLKALISEYKDPAINNGKKIGSWEKAIEIGHIVYESMCSQERDGAYFDVSLGWNLLSKIDTMMLEIGDEVNPHLGMKAISASKQPNFPARPWKADGTLAAASYKYCAKFGITDEMEVREVIEKREPLILEEKMTIANQDDVKQFLISSSGWEPTLWRVKNLLVDQKTKQQFSKNKQQENINKYIYELQKSPYKHFILKELGFKREPDFTSLSFRKKIEKEARNVPSSPQLKDQRGDLCPNLERVNGDIAKKIVRWLSLRNRRTVLKALDDKKKTGWLNKVDDKGRLKPGSTGLTNTRRQKHRDVVNVPKADLDVLLGKEFRSLFIAPPGFYNIGADAAAIEARVAGHYAFPFDGGEYARLLLEADSHQVNAEAYSIAAERVVSRSEGKNITYACCPKDNTQVLSEDGWIDFSGLSVGVKILTYNTKTGKTEFKPIQKVWEFDNQEVINLSNSSWSFESTRDHRWFGDKRRNKRYKECFFTTDEITHDHRILNSSEYIGGTSGITPDESALIAWILSDGYIKWNKKTNRTSSSFGRKRGVYAQICQSKQKYSNEIQDLIDRIGCGYKRYVEHRDNGNHINRWVINSQYIRDLWDKAGISWGLKKEEINWSSFITNLSQNANYSFLAAWFMAEGHLANETKIITQNIGSLSEAILLSATLAGYKCTVYQKTDKCVDIRLCRKRYTTGQRLTKTSRIADVFCVTTENSTFIARQGNHITITGNCLYGATAKKIAKMLGVDQNTAQKVIDAFWDANPGLKAFRDRLTAYWEATGKKYVMGIDGSKIFSRSKHSLLNALFQSTGAAIMDLAGAIAREKTLTLSHENRRWGYFHDELQWYEKKESVQIITFSEKPEMKRDGKIFSKPIELDNGDWMQYYSPVGEILCQSIIEAGERYNMNIALDAEYLCGKNWADCH